MTRFRFPGKYSMLPVKDRKNILAYFNVLDTELGIEFRDVRLPEGKNGVFVAAPFRTYTDSKGRHQVRRLLAALLQRDGGGPRREGRRVRGGNGAGALREVSRYHRLWFQE